jgi:hypothetical protein
MENPFENVVNKYVDQCLSEVKQMLYTKLADAMKTGAVFQPEATRSTPTSKRAKAGAKPRGKVTCIAPGCKNPSKGPRFHFLCDEHKKVPKRDWKAWQEARKAGTSVSPAPTTEAPLRRRAKRKPAQAAGAPTTPLV